MIRVRRVLYILLVIVMVGCGKQLSDLPPTTIPFTPTPPSIEDTGTSNATQEIVVQPTIIREPPSDPFAAVIFASNPANGEVLFATMNSSGFACSTCHNAESEDTIVGPGLYGIPNRAGSRIPGEIAEQYLYESIINPNSYVVENFTDNIMPKTYADIYTETELFDLVAYLMTLQDRPTQAATISTEEMSTEGPSATPSGPTATSTTTLTPTPTATVPSPTPTLTPIGGIEQEQVLRLIQAGIPAFGEQLYNEPIADGQSCADCHLVDSVDELEGPGLFGIEFKASSAAPDVPAEYTIYTWIIDPAVHGDLTQNFGSTFGFDQVYDIVAYLTSLDE